MFCFKRLKSSKFDSAVNSRTSNVLQPRMRRAILRILILLHKTLVHHGLNISTALVLIDTAKQDIHFLQTLPRRLLNKEERPEPHTKGEAPEHNERLPSNIRYRTWRKLRNTEVKQPLRSSTQTDTVRAETGGENLGEVDPGDGTPRGGVADDEEVDHGDHGDGGLRHVV